MKEGTDVAVITLGPIGTTAAEAIRQAESQCSGLSVAHYDLRFLKPLDEEMLTEIGQRFQHIITIEDGARMGGMGSAVLEWMDDHGFRPEIKRLGLPDHFVEHGAVGELRRIVGLDEHSICLLYTSPSPRD